MIFDAHNHIHFLGSPKSRLFLKHLRKKELFRFFVNAANIKDWKPLLQTASPDVIPFLGIHPWNIESREKNWLNILKQALEDPHGGIGETGLDFARNKQNKELQIEVFKSHLKLAREIQRPIAIHCVRAWGALLECLKEIRLPKKSFMIHSFNGSRQIMEELVRLGAFISYSSIEREKQIDIFKATPTDRILIETDFPPPSFISEKDIPEILKKYEAIYRKNLDNAAFFKDIKNSTLNEVLEENGEIFTHTLTIRQREIQPPAG